MKQEKLKIEPHVAYKLACNYYLVDEIEVIEKKLTGSDHEDGGGDYQLTVREKATGNFYQMNFTQWDIDNTDYDDENDRIYPDGSVDIPTELYRVYPKVVTNTIYTETP